MKSSRDSHKKKKVLLLLLLLFLIVLFVFAIFMLKDDSNSSKHNSKKTPEVLNTYTIKFDANGGSVLTSTKEVTHGKEYGELPSPTKKGYNFLGWYLGDQKITDKDKVKITSNVTLVAKYKKVNYTITYALNGGKNNANNPRNYSVDSKTISLLEPTRDGYIFDGWSENIESAPQKKLQIIHGSTGNKSYIAHWSKQSYTITYQLNGGKNNDNNPLSFDVEEKDLIIYAPTKQGYKFIGWTGSNGPIPQTNILIAGGSVGDKTYEAHWSANNIVLENMELNDGTYGSIYVSNSFDEATGGTGSYVYYLSGAPIGATIDSTSRKISFTNSTDAGVYDISVIAIDTNSGKVATATMKVTINRQPVAFPSCENKVYTGGSQILFDRHTSGKYMNEQIIGENVGVYKSNLIPTSNYQWEDGIDSTESRELSCEIVQSSTTTTLSEQSSVFNAESQPVSGAVSKLSNNIEISEAMFTYEYYNGGSCHGSKLILPPSEVGTYSVKAILTGTYNYASSVSECTKYAIYSKKATITPEIESKTIIYPLSATFTYSYDGDGTVICESEDTNYVTCSVNTSTKTVTLNSIKPTASTILVTLKSTSGVNFGAADDKSVSVNIQKGVCESPTGVTISPDKKISWDDNDSASSYQVSINNNTSFVNHVNGSVYESINDTAGEKTIYVRSVCDPSYYANQYSAAATATTTVYNVSLTKTDGILSVSGEGNYISGATVLIDAVQAEGYTWKNWTQTNDVNEVSSEKNYSNTIFSNWKYTANAIPNVYAVTLDNQNATTEGTTTIYEKFNKGYYLSNADGNLSSQMTISSNQIVIPERTGYEFAGYYTETNGGVQFIDASGNLTTEASATQFINNGVLYAKWVKSISNLTSTFDQISYVYDGTPKMPTEIVKDDDTTLIRNEDYTISYINNIDVGKSTAIITGANIYNSTTKAYYVGTTNYNYYINNAELIFNTGTCDNITGSTNLYTKKNEVTVFTTLRGTTEGTIPTASKVGYVFDGWYSSNNGGLKILNADGTFTGNEVPNYTNGASWQATANQNLFAHCTPVKYNVTAQPNGGSISPTNGWIDNGQSISKAVNFDSQYGELPAISRTGYTFDGWVQNFLEKPAIYTTIPNSKITTLNDMFFIKAGTYTFKVDVSNATSWRTIVVLKDANGNDLSDANYRPFKGSYYNSGSYNAWLSSDNGTITSQTITIVEDCYARFYIGVGDTSSSTIVKGYLYSGDSESITSESIVKTPYDHVIKAQWTPKDYILTINPNGGMYSGSSNISTKTLTFDSSNNNDIGIPTRDGYTFDGWYLEPDNKSRLVYDKNGKNTDLLGYWETDNWKHDGDVTVYAHWSKDVSSLDITLTKTNYIYNGSDQGPAVVLKDGTNTLDNNVYSISGNSNTNVGMYDIILTGKNVYNVSTNAYYAGTTNRTYYINNVELLFDKGNCDNIIGIANLYTRKNSTKVFTTLRGNAEGIIPRASKTNYVFQGWYSEANGGIKILNSDGTFSGTAVVGYTDATSWQAMENKVLYAQCTRDTYSITYNMNNGVNNPSNPSIYTVESSAITLGDPTKTITFKGNPNSTNGAYAEGDNLIIGSNTTSSQTFLGWSGTGLIGNDNKSVTIAAGSEEDKEYTAHWVANSGTVPTVAREGYTCGWSTSNSGTTIEIASGATYDVSRITEDTNATVNLYAVCVDNIAPAIISTSSSTALDLRNYVDFNATDAGTGIVGYNITSTDMAPTKWIPVVDTVANNEETEYLNDAAWARIFHQNNHWGEKYFIDREDAKSKDSIDLYSVLNNIDDYKFDNKWELLLEYPENSSGYNRWTQTANPVTDTQPNGPEVTPVAGYTPIKIIWYSGFGGLESSNSVNTLMDGSTGKSDWCYAIGVNSKYYGGMPGNCASTSVANLWARIDTLETTTSSNLTRRIGNITSDGTYYIWVKDDAGNMTSTTVTVNKVDTEKPTAKITSTNNVAASQTLTLTLGDNKAISKYYFGSDDYPRTHYPQYTSLTNTPISHETTVSVDEGGTYYLSAIDVAGNRYYTSKNFYKTVLEANGGIVDTEYVITMQGESFALPTVTRDGYTFGGWYEDSQFNTAVTLTDGKYKPSSSETIYAKWTPKEYLITLDQQNGSGGTTEVLATFDSELSDISIPTRDGYTFGGYYLNNSAIDMANAVSKTNLHIRIDLSSTKNRWLLSTEDKGTHIQAKVIVLDPKEKQHLIEFNDKTVIPVKVEHTINTWIYYLDFDVTEEMVTNRLGYNFSSLYRYIDIEATTETASAVVESVVRDGKKYYDASGSGIYPYDIPSETTLYARWTKTVSDLTKTIDPITYIYDGTEKIPTETVADGDVTLTRDNDYTISFLNTINVGSGSARITGNNTYNADTKAFYTGNASIYYVINNAELKFNAGSCFNVDGSSILYTKKGSSNVYTTIRGSVEGTIPTASKSGYTFNGWYTEKSGGSKVLNTDGTFTGTGVANYTNATSWQTINNQILYAQCTANEYAVTADPNGGVISSLQGWNETNSIVTKNITTDSAYGTLPTVSRNGYTFEGWTIDDSVISSNSADWVQGGIADLSGAYNQLNTRVRLKDYLHVSPNTSYSLTLDNNLDIIIRNVYCYDKNKEFISNIGAYKNYLTFTPPSTCDYINVVIQNVDSSLFISPNDIDSANIYLEEKINDTTNLTVARNHVIRANWVPKTYTLTINPNGGLYGGSAAIKNNTLIYDSSTNNSIDIPTRDGYTFDGWYLDADNKNSQLFDSSGNSTELDGYWSNGNWIHDGDVTVYAHWSKNISSLDISLSESNFIYNGTEQGPTITLKDGTTLLNNELYTVSGNSNVNVGQYGFTISGNNIYSSSTKAFYKGINVSTYNINNAKLTFDKGSCDVISGNSTLYTRKNDSEVYTGIRDVVDGTIPTAAKIGYVFDGWYTSTQGEIKVLNNDGTFANSVANYTDSTSWQMVTNQTLYAKCVKENYSITYNLNNGVNNINNPSSYRPDSDAITLQAPTKTLTFKGNPNSFAGAYAASETVEIGPDTETSQEFYGWSGTGLTGNNNNLVVIASGSEEDKEYTAHWTANEASLPTISKEGHVCGWNTSSNGAYIQYASGGIFPAAAITEDMDSTVNLHAICARNVYTLTINPEGGSYPSMTAGGKNLANVPDVTEATSISIRLNDSSRLNDIDFKPLTQYTISANIEVDSNTKSFGVFVRYTDKTAEYLWLYRRGVLSPKTTKSGKTVEFIQFTYDVLSSVSISNFQLEEGTVATEYEPYVVQYTNGTTTRRVVYDEKYNSDLGVPTKEGFNFDGWYTEAEGGTKIYGSNGQNVNVDGYWNGVYSKGVWKHTGDVVLYAHWSKSMEDLTISSSPTSFIYDGTTKIPLISVKDGNTTLTKDVDYTVEYTNNVDVGTVTATITGTNVYNETTETYYTGTKVITYFINNAQLTFSSENCSDSVDTEILYTKKNDSKLYTGVRSATNATMPVANRTGYTFNGWYTAAVDGTKVLNSDGTFTGTAVVNYTDETTWQLVENKTLYAQCTANELIFNDKTLSSGTYGESYTSSAFSAATNGTGSYTYSIVSGAPANTTINSDERTISFTNNVNAGTYSVVVRATDNYSSKTKDAAMTIVINKAQISIPNSPEFKTYNGLVQSSGITTPEYTTVLSSADLIKNGDGSFGDNTNFSSWSYDSSTSYGGSTGSFKRSISGEPKTDELIALSTEDALTTFSFDAKTEEDVNSDWYSYISYFDIDKNLMYSNHYMYIQGTTTTLARDLKNGDNIVYFTDLSGWDTTVTTRFRKGFIFWNYTNSKGFTYPVHTYSRYTYADKYNDNSDVNVEEGTITLNSPWIGGDFPAGTPVSQSSSGGTFKYNGVVNTNIPTTWTHYYGEYDTIDYSGKNGYLKAPPYAVYGRVGFLWRGNDTGYITNVSLTTETKTSATKVGTYAILYDIDDKNNYEWTDGTTTIKSVPWFINPKDISSTAIAENIEDQIYTGDAITPSPIIKDGNVTLINDVDYTLIYKKNKNVGQASIDVIFKGNYSGYMVLNFNINNG